jgi:hypothetical protein
MRKRRVVIAGGVFVLLVLALAVLYAGQPARLDSWHQIEQTARILWYGVTHGVQVLIAPADWSAVKMHGLARFGEEIEFLGCDVAVTRENGRTRVWQLTVWRAITAPQRDYTLYMHFVRPQEDKPFAQADHLLGRLFLGELKPTTQWKPGEIVTDAIEVPEAFYNDPAAQLGVGLWDPATGFRLPVVTDALHVDENGRLVICQ